jgi:hypothetical protein
MTSKHFNPLAPENLTPAPAQRAGDAYHTLHGYIGRETEKAILFEVCAIDDHSIVDSFTSKQRTQWFPLSQLKSITHAPPESLGYDEDGVIDTELGEDDNPRYDQIVVKEWLLKTKDLY